MLTVRKTRSQLARAALFLTVFIGCLACLGLYPIAALNQARRGGVYHRPEEHIQALAGRSYCGLEKVVIERAGPEAGDGSSPHIWFVTWKIYARSHAPCGSTQPGRPMDYATFDQGGFFYLNTLDGWVWMPEGAFPIYIGLWMKVFQLAGPGASGRTGE